MNGVKLSTFSNAAMSMMYLFILSIYLVQWEVVMELIKLTTLKTILQNSLMKKHAEKHIND